MGKNIQQLNTRKGLGAQVGGHLNQAQAQMEHLFVQLRAPQFTAVALAAWKAVE